MVSQEKIRAGLKHSINLLTCLDQRHLRFNINLTNATRTAINAMEAALKYGLTSNTGVFPRSGSKDNLAKEPYTVQPASLNGAAPGKIQVTVDRNVERKITSMGLPGVEGSVVKDPEPTTLKTGIVGNVPKRNISYEDYEALEKKLARCEKSYKDFKTMAYKVAYGAGPNYTQGNLGSSVEMHCSKLKGQLSEDGRLVKELQAKLSESEELNKVSLEEIGELRDAVQELKTKPINVGDFIKGLEKEGLRMQKEYHKANISEGYSGKNREAWVVLVVWEISSKTADRINCSYGRAKALLQRYAEGDRGYVLVEALLPKPAVRNVYYGRQ